MFIFTFIQLLYSKVFQDLLKIILAQKEACEGDYDVMGGRLLSVYEEALSSNSRHLVEMIQVICARTHLHMSPLSFLTRKALNGTTLFLARHCS